MTLSADESRNKIMENFIKPNIEAAFPNVIVEIELGGGAEDYDNKLKTYNASGDLPDVWYSQTTNALPVIEAGNQLDLTSYITADGFIDKFADDGFLKFKGKEIYAMSSGADSYFTPTIFYNKQIFADNGIEVPTTFDEFIAVCEQLKTAGIVPLSTPGKAGWAPQLFLLETMIMIEDPDVMTGMLANEVSFDNPVIYNALDRIDRLAKAGAFPEGVANLDYGQAMEIFQSDKAAMLMQFTWEISNLQTNPNYGTMNWPTVGDKFNGTNAIQYWGSPLNGYAVNAKSENIDLAVKLAEFCVEQDSLFFNENNAPVAYDTGYVASGLSEMMTVNLERYAAADIYLASLTLNGLDNKVNTELGSLGAYLLTGDYSAKEFVDEFTPIYEANTYFD
jgi:raffinose/stachyose/melibiose transport system substrate-binding protein